MIFLDGFFSQTVWQNKSIYIVSFNIFPFKYEFIVFEFENSVVYLFWLNKNY